MLYFVCHKLLMWPSPKHVICWVEKCKKCLHSSVLEKRQIFPVKCFLIMTSLNLHLKKTLSDNSAWLKSIMWEFNKYSLFSITSQHWPKAKLRHKLSTHKHTKTALVSCYKIVVTGTDTWWSLLVRCHGNCSAKRKEGESRTRSVNVAARPKRTRTNSNSSSNAAAKDRR